MIRSLFVLASRINVVPAPLRFQAKRLACSHALFGGGASFALLGFFEKKLSPEDELLLKIKRAVLAIQRVEYAKADRYLSDAWNAAEALGREDVSTQVMGIQANLALDKGELDKALRLFQLLSQRLVYHEGVETEGNPIVEISLKLSRIYLEKGMLEESLKGLEWAVDTQMAKISKGADDEDTLLLGAWALQSLAHQHMGAGKLKEAQSLAKKAYFYAVSATGPDSEQALGISTDLASLQALQGDINGALIQLNKANQLAEQKFKHLQAAIRVNIGTLRLQNGEYDEANRICKEAKLIARMYRDKESFERADECIEKSEGLIKTKTFIQ